ncbi:unnamed protein product [Nesidiocoris tenuis]|uniref:Angiotensin-converting enzyme n=1 Tax=Nesidiocoris tenuis TaxID=355587 RepID=A0A6H5GR05_9HEMI|nr:unnamed protein product [Nesidiocoris tenuis]
MNTAWWELRSYHQGLLPPVARSEDDFDPGSKYHIISDQPYIRDIMSVGASRPWTEVLRVATKGSASGLDARPMLEYFKPLSLWLRVQNRDERMIGWVTTDQDTDKNANQPANQQQEIPTFVGSDGIVRKVSPSAILAEMKRCFPSGLPIPVEPLWPELPPNLQKEERLDPLDGNYQNREGSNSGTENYQHGNNGNLKFSLLKDEAENKRVLRSEESALKTNILATGNHNGQFDVSPRDSVVYAATELDSKKLTDILKELVTKQLRKNATSEDTHSSYTNAGRIQGRDAVQKTYQTDDYPDYEYEDQKLNSQKPYGSIASREEHQFSRNPKRRRPATRRRQSSHIPKPNIQEYDYEELPDESGTPDQKQLRSWASSATRPGQVRNCLSEQTLNEESTHA